MGVNCSGGSAFVRRGIRSGACDFRAKVGLAFGEVILPTMHLNCNRGIQTGGSRMLRVVVACLIFVGEAVRGVNSWTCLDQVFGRCRFDFSWHVLPGE